MIEGLNALSAQWLAMMTLMTIQSSVFLGALYAVLYIFRGKSAKGLRWISLLGLCKLFVPPLDILPDATPTLAIKFSDLIVFGNYASNDTAIVANVEPTITIQAILFIGWLSTAIGLLLMATARTRVLHQQFKHADGVAMLGLENLKTMRVVRTSERHSPFVFGVFKPTIVLPVGFEAWPERTKQVVLAHELAHLRQYDHVLNVVQSVAKAIHFFNPIVWIFMKKIDELREMSCDDAAIAASRLTSAEYATELLAVAEMNFTDVITQRYRGAIAFSESYHTLKDRLTYQLSTKEDLKMRYAIFSGCIILMMALSLNCNAPKKTDSATITPVSAPLETPDFVEVDVEPMFINQVRPKYPATALTHGIEARVVAKALINETGQAERVEILKYVATDTSANSPDRQAFESEVKKSIQASTFKPAMKNGNPIRVWMAVPTHFKLTTDETPKLISVEKVGGTVWGVNFTVPREMQVTVSVANEKTPEITLAEFSEKCYPHFREGSRTHAHPMRFFFDTKDFPKGTYLFKMNAEDYSETKRVILN